MISFVLALAAAAMAPSAGASPDPTAEQIAMRVDFGDLDLATSAGKKEFLRRVRHAQSRACDQDPGPKTQMAWREIFACKERAQLEASRAIDNAAGGVAVASKERDVPEL